jgi:hypothetical protein
MNFFNNDHSFCEALLYGGPPEYFNAFTSLYISYVGLYGLKNNFHLNNDIFLIYSALFINGIASFAYHWTNYIGFGIIDRSSMILIAIPSINCGIKELNYLYHISELNNKIFLFFNQMYLLALITFLCMGYEEVFNGIFGVFLALILIFIYLLNNKKIKNKYLIYGNYGIFMIFIAGISWIIIEKLCSTFSIMKYLHGHAIWHIFVSSGGYLSSLLLTSLSLNRKNILPYYHLNQLSIVKK